MVNLDPFSANSDETVARIRQNRQVVFAQRFAVDRDVNAEVAERVRVERTALRLPDGHGHLRLRRRFCPDAPRAHEKPRLLVLRYAFQERVCLSDGQCARLEYPPRLKKRKQELVVLRRRFERRENLSERGGLCRIRLQRRGKRQMLCAPIGVRAAHERGKERERTRTALVSLVLREMQANLAHVAPSGAERRDRRQEIAVLLCRKRGNG